MVADAIGRYRRTPYPLVSAMIYRGPFKKVEDDGDHVYYRGQRMTVCDKTFHLLRKEAYTGQCEFVEPLDAFPLESAERLGCNSMHCPCSDSVSLKWNT